MPSLKPFILRFNFELKPEHSVADGKSESGLYGLFTNEIIAYISPNREDVRYLDVR